MVRFSCTYLWCPSNHSLYIPAKLASFQQIVDRVDNKQHSKEKILQALTPIGVLLRGNWLIQSDILYPEKSWSQFNGVPAEFMCQARDYIVSIQTDLFHIHHIGLMCISLAALSVHKEDRSKPPETGRSYSIAYGRAQGGAGISGRAE